MTTHDRLTTPTSLVLTGVATSARVALAAARRHYPDVVTTDEAVYRFLDLLAGKCGLARSAILLADSICSDDGNSVEYPERARAMLGPFKLRGLDGFPHAGLTGMAAFAGHVPDDGGIVVYHAPHIGVSRESTRGMIRRPGQHALSSCGGATRAAPPAHRSAIRRDARSPVGASDVSARAHVLTSPHPQPPHAPTPRICHRWLRRAVLLSGLVVTWSSAGAQSSTPRDRPHGTTARPPRVLTVEAMDYAFRAPASVRAGVTTIRLVNHGTQLHHVQLNRLEDGRSVQDMLREWKPGEPPPSFMTGDGGPTAALGGQTLEGTVVLRPGRYALICWVPAPDGQLHVHKGMFAQLEVTGVEPVTPAPPVLPRADLTITMLDYGYHLPAMRAGRRVIRVFNAGPQAHELVMVRLAAGHTARHAAEWAERGQTGTAPGVMVGGVAALTPGGVAQFTAALTPGEYAVICFVPDQRDGRGHPHTARGMLRQFSIR